MAFILFVACFCLICICIPIYTYYDYHTRKENKPITFKQFKDFYMIAPDNWDIDRYVENEVRYTPTGIEFRFNFIDFWKFKHFKKHPTYDKDIERFLESVQNDVKKYKTEKRKEFNNKIDNIEKERKEKRL